MLIPADAFSHLPVLVGKVLDPEKSTFRISRQTFDDWDRRAREAGYGDNWRRTHVGWPNSSRNRSELG